MNPPGGDGGRGLIKHEDIEAVRERARIDEVVSDYVQLRPAGVGSLKGLCPFHDEKTPSFHVRPQLGYFHCFGCGEGGDVISFVQKIAHVTFVEAVETLAGRFGVQLRYEEGRGGGRRSDFGTRQRLLDAHAIATEYYQGQLATTGAAPGRDFLAHRGFDRAAAERFGIGFAPEGWDNLTKHLRDRGFTEPELMASGLVSQGKRGVYDRFRGRLIWPIRDITGATIGFGARRLLESDQGPKYLNTPETLIYKKSQVLYGIDLARKQIGLERRVVVVEGYTDVMAMHLAGITTAVATCGTAFGEGHIQIVRRLMGDTDRTAGLSLASRAGHGEVVFTFDGDAAGQKAALRAFEQDQKFVAQTSVAVEPNGLDPCDLRLAKGNEAVAALIDTRRPLFEFAIRSALAQVDLDTVEGQVAGLRAAAPVVARIRDRAIRPEYARRLAGWLGLDERQVLRAVSDASRHQGGSGRPADGRSSRAYPRAEDPRGVRSPNPSEPDREPPPEDEPPLRLADLVNPRDPVGRVEAQTLSTLLQVPQVFSADALDELPDEPFHVPALQAVWEAICAQGGVVVVQEGMSQSSWFEQILDSVDPGLRGIVSELAASDLRARNEAQVAPLAAALTERITDLSLTREFSLLRSKLQRTDAAADPQTYQDLMRRMVVLQQRRRARADD